MSEETQVAGTPDGAPEVEVTMNQVVAYNVRYFRLQRGLTQEQLGLALERLTGRPWSKATVSAAERSWEGSRIRQFDADDLMALATALNYPLNAFFLPPDEGKDVRYVYPGLRRSFVNGRTLDPKGDAQDLMTRLFDALEESSEPADQSYMRRVEALFSLHFGRTWANHTLLEWQIRGEGRDAHRNDLLEAQELRKQADVLRVLLANVEDAAQHLEGRYEADPSSQDVWGFDSKK